MADLAQAMVEHFESCRLIAYRDSLDKWTIGWGHLLAPQDHDWTGYTITQEGADNWLESDLAFARQEASRFPHYITMDDVRQAVCVSMCFQLGDKPLSWPDFMAALEAQDYSAAAAAGLDSEWAREQTPTRARQEMSMLSTGMWELRT